MDCATVGSVLLIAIEDIPCMAKQRGCVDFRIVSLANTT